jgi:uridine monophosphate synthetase
MSFFERLSRRAQQVDSLLCVGLDPHPDDLATPTINSLKDFCSRLIEASADVAAAFKPNSAFFEAHGPAGFLALKEVIASIPSTIPVILDAKRGDIASTSEAYAIAVYQQLGAWAVTVNPYLGRDALEPFLADPEKGAFLLCKTSNPGAADLQDLWVHDQTTSLRAHDVHQLYERVALMAQEWNTRDNLGLVVGANQPEALQRVRQLAPDLWILAPGVGVQGGDLKVALEAGIRPDGLGLLVTVSRGISRAEDARNAAQQIRQQINDQRAGILRQLKQKKSPRKIDQSPEFTRLADGLLATGCIKFGQFTLKSGKISPIYIDLRQLISFPGLLDQVARAYIPILNELSFDRLAGLPYSALPIATAICMEAGWPFIYPRKEAKSYGTKAEIEGIFQPGEHVAIIDDLATTGSSKFEAIEKLASVGLEIVDVVVLIDRQSGAKETINNAGYQLHSVTNLSDLLDYYEATGKVSTAEIEATREFIRASQ